MSDNLPGADFWQRVNTVVNVSNDQCDTTAPTEVGASTMFASARFNAFLLAKSTGTAANLTTEKERALDYFTAQYREMLGANLDDFIANFEQYMKPPAQQ